MRNILAFLFVCFQPVKKLGMSGKLQQQKNGTFVRSSRRTTYMPTKFTEHCWQWMLCIRGGNSFPHPATFSFRQIALNWTIYIHIFFPVSNVYVCSFASSFCVCAGLWCERTNDYFIVFHAHNTQHNMISDTRQYAEWIVYGPLVAGAERNVVSQLYL